MTPSELAEVLEAEADYHELGRNHTQLQSALREAAAILRRLGDDALWDEVGVAMKQYQARWAIDVYRRRLLAPESQHYDPNEAIPDEPSDHDARPPRQEYTAKHARENLRAAGFNAPEPQEPVRDVCECPACGGAGYTTRMAHSLHCDGSCSNGLCPVPEPEQCEVCSGTGSIAGEETP